jgi:hypothetical protein
MIWFLIFAELALAAKKSPGFCRPGDTITKKVRFCEENQLFLKQAAECEAALKKQIDHSSAALGKLLQASAAAAGSTQAEKFSQTNQDYGLSSAQLDRLVAFADAAAQDVLAYQDAIVIPEDADNPDIAPDPQKFVDGVPCYADTVKGLKESSARLSKMKESLTAARGASSAFQKLSTGHESNVGAITEDNDPAALKGRQQSAPGFKGGVKPHGESDISGTKPKEE